MRRRRKRKRKRRRRRRRRSEKCKHRIHDLRNEKYSMDTHVFFDWYGDSTPRYDLPLPRRYQHTKNYYYILMIMIIIF